VHSAADCATPEGRKELIGFTDGARESAQDWRDLLLDLKRRGLDVRPTHWREWKVSPSRAHSAPSLAAWPLARRAAD
jgi:hypothetical protein